MMHQKYLHNKTGDAYEKIGEGLHTETMEPLVFYRRIADGTLWARPSSMFYEPGRFTPYPRDETETFQYWPNGRPKPDGWTLVDEASVNLSDGDD